MSGDHDGVAAHQSEGGDHLFDSNLQGGPVYVWAQFLLLACGWLRHYRGEGREKGETVVVGGKVVK